MSLLDNSFFSVLGLYDDTRKKEKAIYYLSKKFIVYKSKYTLLEITCSALTYRTYILSRMDPLKYIFQNPMPTSRLVKWKILLTKFDKIYVKWTTMKAQALADHLAKNPIMRNMKNLRPIFQTKRYPVHMKLFTIIIKDEVII